MARNLARALKSDLSVRDLTEILRRKGRGNDTVLAHITPREMAILKKHGGSGTVNPHTGLPEFDDSFTFDQNWFSPTPDATAATPVTNTAPPALQTDASPGMWSDQQLMQAQTQAAPSWTGGLQTDFTPGASGNDFSSTNPFSYSDPVYAMQAAQVQNTADVPLPPTRPDSFASQASPDGVASINASAGAPTGFPSNVDYAGGQSSSSLDPLQEKIIAAGLNNPNQPGGVQGFLNKLTSDPFKLALALGGAGLGIYGNQQAKKQAANQTAAINNVAAQQSALAQPLLTQGGQLYGQAVQGNLNATNQQKFDAARAQLAQSAANTGGVGAMQATALAENMRQQAIQAQLNQGLQLLGSGDTLMNSALSTQLQAISSQGQYAQQASSAAMNFFGALGKIYGSTV